jgi:hypothetical protein
MPKGWPRSGPCQPGPIWSRPTKSIEMFWIGAKIAACSPHDSDQPSLPSTRVCGDRMVLSRKVPLDGSANQVRLARSAATSSLFQPSAQVSREPHCDSMVFHLSDILSDCRTAGIRTSGPAPRQTQARKPVPHREPRSHECWPAGNGLGDEETFRSGRSKKRTHPRLVRTECFHLCAFSKS